MASTPDKPQPQGSYSEDGYRTALASLEALEQRKAEIQRKFREIYIPKTYKELGAASFEETMDLLTGLDFIPLEESGIREWEEAWESRYVPMMEAADKLYHEELMENLRTGCRHEPRYVSLENIEEWSHRFKNPGVHYKEKERFIRDTLPEYVGRWKKVAEARAELLKNPALASLTEREIRHLPKFLDENAFLNLHYNERANLVATIETALGVRGDAARERLFVEAKDMLEDAAEEGIVSRSNIGSILQKLFKNQNAGQLRTFIHGAEGFTLQSYIAKCRALRQRFDRIEERREKDWTPNFHFVKLDVFLGWDYRRQKSYVTQGEHSFESLAETPPEFLKIRHAFAAEDWLEAAEFLADAEKKPWGAAHSQELRSMREYWKAHCQNADETQKQANEKPGAEEVLAKMRSAMGQIPYNSIRERLRCGMEYGAQTLWVLCTMYYNWEWCRQRGYSNDAVDADQREQAKDSTYRHLAEGQSRDHTINDMTGDTSKQPAIRTFHDTRSAQGVFVDDKTDNKVLARVAHQNEDNWSFWYWTRMVEKDIPYSIVPYLVHNVFPTLKWGMRRLDEMGIRYTESGPPVKKGQSIAPAAYQAGMHPKQN